MSVPTWDHLKEDGVFCNSPALKGRNYCYFHLNLRGRRLKAARARRRGDNPPLHLPFPEDMHAVQVSLAEILWAIAEGRIEHKAAGLMLYALQQAATNLSSTREWQGARPQVELDRPLRAIECPSLEEHYGLPSDIDLESPPEVAVQEAEENAALSPTERKQKKPRRRLARVRGPRPETHYRPAGDATYDDEDDNDPGSYNDLRHTLVGLRCTPLAPAPGDPPQPSFGDCGEASVSLAPALGTALLAARWENGGATLSTACPTPPARFCRGGCFRGSRVGG